MADDPLDQQLTRLVAMAEQLEETKAELAAARKVMDRPIQVTVSSSSDQDATLRKIEVRQTEVVGQMMQALEVQQRISGNLVSMAAQLKGIDGTLKGLVDILGRLIPEPPEGGLEADERFIHTDEQDALEPWDGRVCKRYGSLWEIFDPGDRDPLSAGDSCTRDHTIWRKQ